MGKLKIEPNSYGNMGNMAWTKHHANPAWQRFGNKNEQAVPETFSGYPGKTQKIPNTGICVRYWECRKSNSIGVLS